MSIHVFLFMLLICSTFTGLVVEGIKNMLSNRGKTFSSSNVTVAVVAVILALAVSICYAIWFGLQFTAQYIICIIVLCVLSWLCSMVGYDKVIQTIKQITGK